MDKNSTHQNWLREKETLENYKKINPQLLIISSPPLEKEVFSRIGITIPFSPRSKGYIRRYLQDFIVEEISENQEISEIEPKENELPKEEIPSPFTLYANLIKAGISTIETLNELSETLKININKISYAGFKDIKALTSQRITFSNINFETFKRIKEFSSPNFFLTNFLFGKGSITPGELYGNRFTIFVRTKEKLDEKWLSEKLDKLKNKGFLNFYQAQRFGTPRFLSHFFGKLILQEKYKETVFAFFCEPGIKEYPFLIKIRKKAKKLFGRWKEMEKLFEILPYTFRNELRLLSYLKKNPQNFIGALIFFKDQTTIWIYAYTSYLFNLVLSLDKKIDLPEEIPILLSDNQRDWEIYKHWTDEDKIKNIRKSTQVFPFIRFKRRMIKTRIFPKEILFKILPEGVILNFGLEKGIYATTFLMDLFELKYGLPLPEWLKTKQYDIKKELKIGSIDKIKNILALHSLNLENKK